MNFNIISKVFLFVLISSLTGCNAYQTKKRMGSLETTLTSYNVALRWAEHKTLYSYYVSPNGTQPPADLDALEEVSVTGIKEVDKIINEEQTHANIKLVVKYYLKSEGSIKTLKLDQEWWYNEPNKQWFIDGEFPVFK
ncbi:MAG TPA: hypothetical protein EYQ42_10600 [Thiotrichaceae bacterium]|jgi:hypothetical protein|nr:hypothetical protein [Thiotrichaceae bacterium]HIM07881.1 hypothetical protein [Gammaproteobacteria bacterium]